MAAKVKALQQWCKLRCDGYRDVEITNFTSSWKSGLAFCAIIHRFRPDLIDYDSLKKEDTYGNSKLAFDVALNELGIAALLDPEDMVAMKVPDKLCIITYVAQYYNYFHDKQQLGGPGVKVAVKRPRPSADDKENRFINPNAPKSEVAASVNQISPQAKRRTIEDRCSLCQGKVYLLERHYSGGKLYHRHCCREAERASTLRRNRENFGPPSDQKENAISGKPAPVEASKTSSVFGWGRKNADTEPTSKPTSSTAAVKVASTASDSSKYSPYTTPAVTSKTVITAGPSKLSPFTTATTASTSPSKLSPYTTSPATTSAAGASRLSPFTTPTATLR